VRIVEIEAVVLRVPALDRSIADGSQDDVLVVVTTDEGVYGIGEVDSSPEVIKAIIEAPPSHLVAAGLRSVLVGETVSPDDPLGEVARLWDKMYAGSIMYGRDGAAIHAISGVEIALWDILGKVADLPVSALLGEVRREKVKAYASVLMPDHELKVHDLVDSLIERGFQAIKLGWGPLGKDSGHDIKLATAAREAAGECVEIFIDAGFGYGDDVDAAARFARGLEELEVGWLEEPFRPDEYDAYAELVDTVDLRIAAGENENTLRAFASMLDRVDLGVIQPDVTHCGLSQILRIAELVDGERTWIVPHAWKSGIIKAASLHCNAVLPHARYQEYCAAETGINSDLTFETFPIDQDGFVAVPTGPGLGININPEVVERYAQGPIPVALKSV